MANKRVEHRMPHAGPLADKRVKDAADKLCWAGLTRPEAEDLLDWLEANGYQRTLLRHAAAKGFTVQAIAPDVVSELPIAVERRAAVRRHLRPEAAAVLVLAGNGQRVSGVVRDISADGIGLLLGIPCEPGTLMSVGWADKAWVCPHNLAMRVVRVVPQVDGAYLIGGVLTGRFNLDELQAMLA